MCTRAPQTKEHVALQWPFWPILDLHGTTLGTIRSGTVKVWHEKGQQPSSSMFLGLRRACAQKGPDPVYGFTQYSVTSSHQPSTALPTRHVRRGTLRKRKVFIHGARRGPVHGPESRSQRFACAARSFLRRLTRPSDRRDRCGTTAACSSTVGAAAPPCS